MACPRYRVKSFVRPQGRPKRLRLSDLLRDCSGGVAVTVAVSMTAMIGLVALSLDLGRAYNLSTELDNAADAYAIAGASQLDQTTGACARAILAASAAATGNPLVLQNQETFADNANGPITISAALSLSNPNIKFLTTLEKDAQGRIKTAAYIPPSASMSDCDSDAQFIEVTIDTDANQTQYSVGYLLAGVLSGFNPNVARSANPIGYAVAGIGNAYCGVAPMFMCEFPGNLTFQDVVADPAGHRGRGIWLTADNPNSQLGEGNFGFISVNGAFSGGGAAQLGQALGMVNPPQLCLGTNGLETEPGANSGARHGFNTRFDIFQGQGVSNKTADPQWQPAANTVKGLVHDGCNLAGWKTPGTVYNGPGTMPSPVPADAAMPFPMDNCAYPSGGSTCTPANTRLGIGDWDFETYLAVNHPTWTMAAAMLEIMPSATPASTYGRTDGVTRFDVYRWELGYPDINNYGAGDYGTVDTSMHRLVDNINATPPLVRPLGGGAPPPTPQIAEYGGPQCFTGPMGNSGSTQVDQDRRTMRIAMVDCVANTIQGQTQNVTAEGFVDVFVLSPWEVNGNQHEIYVELIGPANNQGINRTLAQQIVQLYE